MPIFISFSKHDMPFARYLRDLLSDRDFNVWLDDQERMPTAAQWPTFEQQIKQSAVFMIIMSPEAFDSKWIDRELQIAESSAGVTIIPILLMGDVWERLASLPYENMSNGLAAKLNPELVDRLNNLLATEKQGVAQ